MFSLRFLVRSLFIRFLKIKDTEVRQLRIAEQFIENDATVTVLNENKIKMRLLIHQVPAEIILRKNTSDLLVLNQVIRQQEYAPLLDLVLKYSDREAIKIIVDAGANIGLSSLYFNTLFPNACVYAIEPSERNFLVMQENIEVNSIKVVALNKALLPSKGKVKLRNTFRDKKDWSTQVAPSDSEDDIEAIPLSDLKRDYNLDVIDVLKLDIEGHEYELFESKTFLTELERIRFIAIEVHEEYADRITIINLLQERGYKLISRRETIFGYNDRSK